MEANEVHYFSYLFDEVHCPSSAVSQHCIHSNTCQFCWLSASRHQQNWHVLLCIQCWDTADDGQWTCPKYV